MIIFNFTETHCVYPFYLKNKIKKEVGGLYFYLATNHCEQIRDEQL